MQADLENIREILNSQGRTVTWLSERMEMTTRTFYKKCKTKFGVAEKHYMGYLLGVDFN